MHTELLRETIMDYLTHQAGRREEYVLREG